MRYPVVFRNVFHALANLRSPAERYRNARTLHGIRVSIAMLATILLTTGIDLPHGVWASVSMMVVIGGLQHQGSIRQKAFERAVGTALGAALGLAYVAQYAVFGAIGLTYALLSITAGVCAFYAVGKGGYIALLTAITMCIVAGHGDDSIEIGLWRTANVLIGIAIALAFSFAFPLHASYSWRYGLAANVRKSARVIRRMTKGPAMTADERLAAFSDLSVRLTALRGLMPSVARESHISIPALESIQRAHRALLSALEMLGSVPLLALEAESGRGRSLLAARSHEIRRTLLQIARELRAERVLPVAVAREGAPAIGDSGAPVDMRLLGASWTLEQIGIQANRLRDSLRVDGAAWSK